MGLRDRLAANYYIPLVAGVDSAARNGTLAPPEVYAPGLFPGGTGQPGGVGTGDGGTNTPDDAELTKPAITVPANGATNVSTLVTALSTAFGSTRPGETHIKSRWVLEWRGTNVSASPSPYVVYDSGPVTSALTSKSLAGLLGHDQTYALKVRYKGSEGGWSPWSDYSQFTTGPCPPSTLMPVSMDQLYGFTYAGGVLTEHTDPMAPPIDVADWTDVKAYLVDALWDDRGAVIGNAATIEPTYVDHTLTVYSGPVVLVQNGSGPVNLKTVNVYAGDCAGSCTLRWTGMAPHPEACLTFPPQGDTSDPPPLVFVPPSSQPPQAEPLPGVPPNSAESFGPVVLDLDQSLIRTQATVVASQWNQMRLREAMAAGGWSTDRSFAQLLLVFTNTAPYAQTVNWAVTTDSERVKVFKAGGDSAFRRDVVGGPITTFQTTTVLPRHYKVEVLQLQLDPPNVESHIVKIDLGDGHPLEFRVGFGAEPYLELA